MAATTLGSSLAFIDGSVVNVALPALAQGLHADPSILPWAINAYLLPLGALILLGGGFGDHFGRRRLFLIGLLLFAAASILCAAAPTFSWLLAGRGAQGIGAALLMPNSLAILGGAFAGEERGRAIGTWAAVGAVAGAVGPIVGGWLIDVSGWRSIFIINIPVASAAGYLAWGFVAEQKEGAKSAPLDVVGAALATAALGLLTWSLTEAASSHRSTIAIGSAMVGGAALGGIFLWQERRLTDRALMPLSMFSSSSFVGLTLLTLFLYGSLGGLLVLLPFLLIQIHHWSAVAAGAALLPIPALIGIGSRSMGRVAARIGGRMLMSTGCMLVGLGLALYGHLGANAVDYWFDIFPPTLLVAVGMGVCVAPLTTSVMASVDTNRVGIASAVNNAVARIAGLVATALLGLVLSKQDSPIVFIQAFRAAAFVAAASAVLAGIFAITLIRTDEKRECAIR
ncbi:MAG TPA: MFS transporter [Steroidobacteraceae bacterium]|nr:MFS transporter [Steroidobacteraceae bacterium]